MCRKSREKCKCQTVTAIACEHSRALLRRFLRRLFANWRSESIRSSRALEVLFRGLQVVALRQSHRMPDPTANDMRRILLDQFRRA
jgi:hypothetical protein